jgi:probable HAF family extracellular repeat protein
MKSRAPVLAVPSVGGADLRRKTKRFAIMAALGVAAVASTTGSASATTYTFTTINPPPGYIGSQATGINDSGQVVGRFESVGFTQGFLDTNGTITPIVVPNSVHGSVPFDINDRGQIVGGFVEDASTGYSLGFLDTNGIFTTLDVPGSLETSPTGINNLGQIVGNYISDSDSSGHGFVYANGIYTTFDVPSAFGSYTEPWGINDLGQIVGSFIPHDGTPGCTASGFLDTGGAFSVINVPGAKCTQAVGINNSGEIIGRFQIENGPVQSFIDKKGVLTTIDVPGSTSTQAIGINNRGQIVGEFDDPSLAFVATPVPLSVPEPATWAMFLVGFGAIGFAMRRGKSTCSA